MLNRLRMIHTELAEFTEDCRRDMHEPDEQGVSAKVFGDHLDNACGNHIGLEQLTGNFQEFVVVIKNGHDGEFRVNLADLIALARYADFG